MAQNFATDNPDPIRGGRSCTILAVNHLLDWSHNYRRRTVMGVIRDLVARDQMGFERYGQNLETNDGRDTLADLYQEVLDALQYATKADEEGASDVLEFRKIIQELAQMAMSIKHAEEMRMRS